MFAGYYTEADGAGTRIYDEQGNPAVSTWSIAKDTTLHAQWTAIDFDLDSEPKDEDYVGSWKGESPDVTLEEGTGDQVIANPQRPGYVFIGWVSDNDPNDKGLVSSVGEGDDKKWVIDSDKLLDYTGEDGRVHLTARWTSVISVDVPSSVTFYADVVTQGNESREGLASSAFGQSKVASQSEVGLRIVGLESKQVKGNGSTGLGASDILKKKDGSDLPATSDKLFSLYPATGELKEDDLKDPDATSASKPEGAVDFSLDDILLEKSFAADKFTIPAGDTLSLGYRLNLQETGTELDYDKLSTLSEGASASIANISYCFAADYGPVFWTADDDGTTLELASIKADAEKIAAGDASTISKYTRWMNADHRFYVKWYDQGVAEADNPTKATVYDVRIIGLNHDDKSDGSGKAGITFQFVDCLNDKGLYTDDASLVVEGWGKSLLRKKMNEGEIFEQVPKQLASRMECVSKKYLSRSMVASVSDDRLFVPAYREVASNADDIPEQYTFRAAWAALAVESRDGEAYPFYRALGLGSSEGNLSASKKANGAAVEWWFRTIDLRTGYSGWQQYVMACSGKGAPTASSSCLVSYGIAPCFCL